MKKHLNSFDIKCEWNLPVHLLNLKTMRSYIVKLRTTIPAKLKIAGIESFKIEKFKFNKLSINVICLSMFLLSISNSLQAQVQLKGEAAMKEKVKQTLKKNAETLRFMENKGQLTDKNILYYFEGRKTAVYIEKTKIRFVAKDYEITKHKFLEDRIHLKGTHTFTLNLNGSNPNALIKLGNSFSTKYNYFNGKDSKRWTSSVSAAKDLTLEDVYPGIDIRLYSSADGSLEFDWIMDPGADYHKINMQLEGQDKISVDDNGSLKVGLRFTDIKFKIPESYQVTEQGKVPVNFAFNTDGKGKVNFKTNSKIDSKYPVVIDPILTWGTFMDGDDPDFDQYLFAIQVDPVDGMVYCAGATNREISTSSAPYDADGYLNSISGFGVDGTPRVAVIYRINSGGSDLVDLTLFGPGSVVVGDEVAAYGLSLSNNRVFICGKTTVDLPTTGSPFDATRDGNDGFVAVFSKNLGTLYYSTYLGSTGDEPLGATSIRAINDNIFVVGMTTNAALPGSYISASAVDKIFGGGSEMYIAKFSNYNVLTWGTYVGGDAEETFNDLEVFPDGRVAFAGWGNNTNAQFPQVNSAATQSDLNDNTDGIIGVLNSTATAFNYLDEIGGPGNDRINDVEITTVGLAFTGSVSDGFPTSSGAYNQTNSGGTDVVVGTVNATGGSASYKATFFGGSGNDIGSGVKEVTQYNCAGIAESFLLVFGTTAQDAVGIPTVNLKNESFYSATNSGGLDMFFAGFDEYVTTLKYATNIGGIYNDYLGDTGDPRGANHLCVKGGNIYVGTTTHSDSHTPAIIGGPGFDQIKTNIANPTSDDAHVIFSIEFTAILESDYSDAPSTYGNPVHILDCNHIRINTLEDGDPGPLPSSDASGDNLNNLNDEDGVAIFPTLTNGGPQNISITARLLLNTTGLPANMYAWIDLNGDGVFKANEMQKVVVPNGFSGDIPITWTGVTISGPVGAHFLRLRLTTDNLADDVGTPNVDERAIVSASNGEVEDYSLVTLNCPSPQTESTCQLQSAINTKYAAWLASASAGGGCAGVLTNDGPGSPSACGETRTVTFTYSSTCKPFATTCSSVFTVTAPTAVVLNCPVNVTETTCQTQAAINAKYANWLTTATKSGGCNSSLTNNSTGAPSACGGAKTVVFTVTSGCEPAKTCSATFTVTTASSVVLNCPSNTTEATCQTQANIDSKYTNWLATVSTSGGCNSSLTNNSTGAPSACGGIKTVTFTVTSSCEPPVTCSASFTVTAPASVVLNCPANVTEAPCQGQAVIDAKFAAWLATANASGGCNGLLSNNNTGAPNHCLGGTKTVNFTYTNSCGAPQTCSATFTVSIAAPNWTLIKSSTKNPNNYSAKGDLLTYSIVIHNTGNLSISNVVVTDPDADSGSIIYVSGDLNGNSILETSETWTYSATHTVKQPDLNNGNFINTATATGTPVGGSLSPVSDTANVPAIQSLSIDLIKTGTLDMNVVAPNGIANVGDKINYTFTVTNTSNVTLTNITVTDPIVTVIGGPITLVPGASDNTTFTGVYTLTQADINSGKKDNTATTSGKGPQNQTVTDTDDETTILPKIATITLVKTGTLNMNFVAPNGIANVGDKINYTFSVTNTGNVTLTNVTVTDPIVTVSGGPITLAPGATNNSTFTGVYTLTQADIDSGKKDNTATTTGKDPQNISVTNTDDETTILPKNASISLLKTGILNMNVIAPNGIANVGDKINYTFKVTNTGNVTLTNVTVTDPIVTVIGGPITLAPGAVDNITFTGVYTLTQADIDSGKKDNTATTSGKDPQNVSVTNTDDETTILPKNASIDLVKTGILNMNVVAPNGITNVGDKINYTFKVTNTGNVTLTNVTVTDPIVTVIGGPVTLAPGAVDNTTFTGVYTLTQADIDSGKKDNTATTTGKDPQNINVTDTDDETTILPKIASIDLVKTGVLNMNVIAPNGIANVGDKINYTFKVTNTGNVTLSNVTVTDPIVTVIGGPVTLAPGAIDNVTFTGVYTLTQADIDSGKKDNTATTTGKDPQNLNVTDTDDETTILPKIASIDLIKTGTLNMNVIAPNGITNVGDKINYTFKVTNTGNVTLTNVTVTDPIVTVIGGPITLAPGAIDNTTFTGVYTLTQADIDSGKKDNTATTTGKDPQNITITDTDDETTLLPKIATIDLVKTGLLNMNVIAPNGIANVGDKINYTFKVTNTGNVTLTNVTVTDPIVSVIGGPITLAPGAIDNTTFTGVYTLTQADIDSGRKDNTATTTGKDPQNITVTNTDDETTILPKIATITLVKTGILNMNVVAPNGITNVGDKINYTFKVTNTGNVTLHNIVVTDPIVTVIGGPITLAPGAFDNSTFTGVYTLTQADIDSGKKDNTATTTGKDPQNINVTNTDDETTPIPLVPNITLEKSGKWNDLNNDGFANVGETISYKFKVCNTGNVTLTNVTVTDPLVTVTGGPISVLAVGTCNSIVFTGNYVITQMDIDSGKVINVATTKGIDPKGNPVMDVSDDPNDLTNKDPDGDGDPDDPTITVLPQNPKIGTAKKLVSVVNNLDGTFTSKFEITVQNNGNVTLGDIQLTDNLTTEFGNYIVPLPLNPGEYSVKNLAMIINSVNPLTLNSSFNGKTNLNLFNVVSGGTIKVGEFMKLGFEVVFRPLKYVYYNQAVAYGDKPINDDPTSLPDDDPEDTKDSSDSGSNATNDPATGGSNVGEPGDKGTVNDPTMIKVPAGQLKGTVWDDLNGNGLQDINEPGLKGVEAWLYNCGGALLKKDTTDLSGNYIFDFLETPKDYYVIFKPIGYTPQYGFTFPNVGLNDNLDSDVDSSGVGPCTTLDLYEKDSTYDAGLVRLASTGDFVWIDKDGNGIQDPGEGGIQGVKVTVFNAATKTEISNTLTNSTGHYTLKDLMPNDYYLKFEAPANWIQTIPNATLDYQDSDVDNTNGFGTTATTHLSPGENDITWDAGYYTCGKILGYIWLDYDMDGVFDPEEKGINGMNVYLMDAISGNTMSTVKTKVTPGTASDDGYYLFDCVKPGIYYIKFERPQTLAATAPYRGNNPNKDSDITHENGINTTKKFTLLSGETKTDLFGGFQIKSEVGDKIWVDANSNGIQDANELPLSNVNVYAYNILGTKVSEAQSGADGKFMLDGLSDGQFYVKFELPGSKYGFTKAHAGTDDLDSDVDGTYGYGSTKMFSVFAGEVKPTIDAGVVSQVLPIEWLTFNGSYNGEFVELNWTTGSEDDNDHFEVERRFESDKDFVSIEKVAAHGSPNVAKHDYEFDDFDVKNSGVYYYRVKQVDKDGAFTYSKIISIRVKEEREDMSISIYPNPASELLKVELWIPEDTDLEIKVYDNDGRTIKNALLNQFKPKGKYDEIIQTSELITGQYVLQIKTSSGVIHKKFTVSR